MNTLVANYDSSSDSYSDTEEKEEHENLEDGTEDKKERIHFLADCAENDHSSSEEENIDSNELNSAVEYLKNRQKNTVPDIIVESLPSPALDKKVKSTINSKADTLHGSIYENNFQKAEDAKLSILEKHVKVTTVGKADVIGGKKVCWNYRKLGKCRQGHRCTFAHDNDIPQQFSEAKDVENSSSTDPNFSNTNNQNSFRFGEGNKNSFKFGEGYYRESQQDNTRELPDDDSYMSNMKRKKKYGVKDGLAPPKKALNHLVQERTEERPWTIKK